MFDTFINYYQENVVTAFIEYRDRSIDSLTGRSRDLRGALVAANALFHLREHLLAPNTQSREQVELACPDYALLGDIVNSAKHKTLKNKTPHGAPLITNADGLGERIIITEYEDEKGSYTYTQKKVSVLLDNGSERDLLEVLTNVINYWEQYLTLVGIIKSARIFEYYGGVTFRSRQESEENQLNIEILQGSQLGLNMQLLRFDNKTGTASPINLTGWQFHLSVYKPKREIDISLTHESGKELQTTISLSEEESLEFVTIKNEEKQIEYLRSLDAFRAAIEKLINDEKI